MHNVLKVKLFILAQCGGNGGKVGGSQNGAVAVSDVVGAVDLHCRGRGRRSCLGRHTMSSPSFNVLLSLGL